MTSPTPNTWTVRDCLSWTAQHFTAKEIPNPRVDAEELLAHAYELPRLQLLLKMDQQVPPPVREKYRAYVQRRAKREPLQHILGCVDFFGFRLTTTPGVLIPRPETEGLVEHAVTFLRELRPVPKAALPTALLTDTAATTASSPTALAPQSSPSDLASSPPPAAAPASLSAPPNLASAPPLRVWDIGTGSGCIAIAIAKMHPQTSVLATDLAPAALELAKRNADRNGLATRINFRKADLDQGLTFTAPFDLIVSNPPYIAEGCRPTIQPEVAHDPPEALYAGPDGLSVLRRILAVAVSHLHSHGRLMLEIGHDQGPAMAALAAQQGYRNILISKDLSGMDRYCLLTAAAR
ncbi:MAG TPA: HemK/PrmC family methyltransferase [Planctomycetota bacterium]|nr:HemK/PrmC family methyltransferase [Planctomycetota bacterium]